MIVISEEIDYVIFFVGAIITIIILLYGIGNIVFNLLKKLSEIPDDLSYLKQKIAKWHQDVQKLSEKIFNIEGQMQTYCKFVDQLITGDK